MRFFSVLNIVSGVVLLGAALCKMYFGYWASLVFLASSVLFAVSQFFLRVRGGSYVLRRLVVQQLLGAVALIVAGVLMFTHVRNEWMVAMSVGALLELYSSFRISQEAEKEGL